LPAQIISLNSCFPTIFHREIHQFPWQVVEIGKGSKVKYELDKKSGLIKVWFRFSYFHSICFDVFEKDERLSSKGVAFTVSKLITATFLYVMKHK